jgi:Peptidase family M1 domain
MLEFCGCWTVQALRVMIDDMRRQLLLLSALCLSACTAAYAQTPTAVPMPTQTRIIQSTPVPTLERRVQSIDVTQTTAPTLQPTPSCFVAANPRTAHIVRADIDYAGHGASVRQQTTFTNTGSAALDEIVFDIETNRVPDILRIMDAVVDGQAVAYALDGRRFSIALAQPLAIGCSLRIELAFDLAIPPIAQGLEGYRGYFGYSPRQLNLGHWLPIVAYRVGNEWIIHEPLGIGEQTVAEVADWDITLRVNGAGEQLKIAAPGEMTRPQPNEWRFIHSASREFTASLSESFQLSTAQSTNGVVVELYTFPDTPVQTENGIVDGAPHALEVATAALSMYSDLFGAYPSRRFVIVQGDFPDGMEFSGIVFVSTSWFRSWVGTPQSYLTLIAVHEVAHQWWYARIGNDQALTPWLDEALATYSELIFYEEYYPDLREWWWQFRVYSYVPDGFVADRAVDSVVYQFDSIRQYINAVYLRGARMLGELRQDVGNEAFFAWLRAYAEAGDGRVINSDIFWAQLTPSQVQLTAETRARYFTQPN